MEGIQKVLNLAEKIFKDTSLPMKHLFVRWNIEKEFEDLNDYAIPLKETVERHGGKFKEICGEPFGFSYYIDEIGFKITVKNNKIVQEVLN